LRVISWRRARLAFQEVARPEVLFGVPLPLPGLRHLPEHAVPEGDLPEELCPSARCNDPTRGQAVEKNILLFRHNLKAWPRIPGPAKALRGRSELKMTLNRQHRRKQLKRLNSNRQGRQDRQEEQFNN
jgi:hypothetical protein